MGKRFLMGTFAIICAVLLGAFALVSPAQDGSSRDENNGIPDSLVKQGFAIAPVQLTYKKHDRKKVGYGSYLVNAVGGCNDCHTAPSYAPGGNPFMGQPEQINTAHYLAGGQQFGPFISRNITPDASGKPAGMTEEEFITTIRTGADMDNPGQLLQVMPWPTYRKMTDRDLQSIYAYLSAIPHADPPAG